MWCRRTRSGRRNLGSTATRPRLVALVRPPGTPVALCVCTTGTTHANSDGFRMTGSRPTFTSCTGTSSTRSTSAAIRAGRLRMPHTATRPGRPIRSVLTSCARCCDDERLQTPTSPRLARTGETASTPYRTYWAIRKLRGHQPRFSRQPWLQPGRKFSRWRPFRCG